MTKYAFWSYDRYPYVVGGTIEGDIEYPDGQPRAFIKEYNGKMKVLAILEGEEGQKALEQIHALRAEYSAAMEEFQKLHMGKAKIALPFLSTFPSYRE